MKSCHFVAGTCISDHSVCSEVWGSCRSILTSLSIVDVIQAGVDRSFFFFFSYNLELGAEVLPQSVCDKRE